MNSYLLLGTILSPDTPSHLSTYKAMLIRDGHIADVFSTIPSTDVVSSDIPRIDTGTALIIPGFSDIHLHAPQFANLGLGLDEELLPWLETYTFPEESKYKDILCHRHVHSLYQGSINQRHYLLGYFCLHSHAGYTPAYVTIGARRTTRLRRQSKYGS